MTRLRVLIGSVGVFKKGQAGPPEAWLLAPFLLALPAAAFAWWVLVVRPIWMPEPEVRQAALVLYLVYAILPVIALVAHRKGTVATANLLTLATCLLFGIAAFMYPGKAAFSLGILATVAAVAALAAAARTLLSALRNVLKTPMMNYLLVILPAVLIVIVGESVLWESERCNLIRLLAVGLCAIAVWGGVRQWGRMPGVLVKLLTILTAGLTLAVVAEALRVGDAARYASAARLLQGFGGRFLAYFSAGMSLSLLPSAARGDLSALAKEGEHGEG